jgi:glycosyltransferase involved in cell wall biosynthesis
VDRGRERQAGLDAAGHFLPRFRSCRDGTAFELRLAGSPMRIAQLAPLAESVPPKLYGGTERVVAWLVDELVALGHQVTLFASGDSQTRGELHAVWPRALRLGRKGTDPTAACAVLLEAVAKRAKDFDVIHAHIDWLPLPLLSRLGVPFLTTMHGRLDLPGLDNVVREFPRAPFVSISDDQRRPLPEANWTATIHHGLPPDLFRSSDAPGSYLAFLGRLTAEKGPEDAIRIAHAVRRPLRIAAKIPRGETVFFKKRLEPLIDGKKVHLVGEVDDAKKQPFLAQAAALLFPIDWPEPFGLVMIEAMACGTPVIAYRSGSVPEVIEDGVTGFIVEDEKQAIAAVHRLEQLDRRKIRSRFEERFSAKRMAKEYEGLYRKLATAKASSASARLDMPPKKIRKSAASKGNNAVL